MSVGDGEDISLVIGGNGFIGSALVRHLDTNGRKVRVYDRGEPQAGRHGAGVHYLRGGLDDTAALDASMAGVGTVFHLASSTVPGTSNLDPAADVTTNLLGTLNVIDAMKRRGIRRLVFLSSGGTVYGDAEICPVPEDAALAPISSYGVVKVAIEKYLGMYHHLGVIDPLIIRPSNPYGPGQPVRGAQGAVAVFLGKALHGEPIDIWGTGEIIRDYIFIDDLVELIAHAASSGYSGVVNAGSGEPFTLSQLCDAITTATGRDLTINHRPARQFDVKRVVLDISKARSLFGWSPRVGLGDGLVLAWDWVRSRND